MAKETEVGPDVNEPIEGQEEVQPSQDAGGSSIDIKRLIMFAIIAWLAVGGAFIVVFRMNRTSEDGLEAAEQLYAPSDEESELSETGANDQLSGTDAANADPESDAEAEDIISEPIIVSFENTITNISGTNGRRFLKTRVNLELADTGVESKIRAHMVQLRDRLLAILSAKTINELDGWEHQDIIRREIKDEFNILLRIEGFEGVKTVYFTEFVIQ